MQLQLVPVRVEKIERCPLAFVLLPDGDARLLEPLRERFKIFFRHGKRVVGVVALLRRHVPARLVVRQADPQIAAGEIGPGIPAGVQRQPQQLVPEGDAFLQVADREGQVVERLQHDVPFCFSRRTWYGKEMNINHAVLTVNRWWLPS